MTFPQIIFMLLALIGLLGVNGIYNVIRAIHAETIAQTKLLVALSETFIKAHQAIEASLADEEANDEQS